MPAPVLEAKRLRIDVAGMPAIDGLSLETTGDAVIVIGASRALFSAAAGLRPFAHGELRVDGLAPSEAIASLRVATAPSTAASTPSATLAARTGADLSDPRADTALPPRWTPLAYATWSARLAGHTLAESARRAAAALDALAMQAVATAPLGQAPTHIQRATLVAGALATGASTLLLDDPLAGLPDEEARPLGRSIARALDGKRWVLFAGRVPLSSPLAIFADEALVIAGSDVIAQGAPAEMAARERTYFVRLVGDAETFVSRVVSGGGHVLGRGNERVVDLGETLATRDLFALADESQATVLELRPTSRGF